MAGQDDNPLLIGKMNQMLYELTEENIQIPHLSCVTKHVINLSMQVIDPKSQKNRSESEMNSLLLGRGIQKLK